MERLGPKHKLQNGKMSMEFTGKGIHWYQWMVRASQDKWPQLSSTHLPAPAISSFFRKLSRRFVSLVWHQAMCISISYHHLWGVSACVAKTKAMEMSCDLSYFTSIISQWTCSLPPLDHCFELLRTTSGGLQPSGRLSGSTSGPGSFLVAFPL